MEIRCADCGCLPSECKASPLPENVPIAHDRNVAADGFQCIARFITPLILSLLL